MSRRLTIPILLGLLGLIVGCQQPPHPAKPGAPKPEEKPGRTTVGNGSEDTDAATEAAWFVGPRKIRYCYRLAPGFGVPKPEVERILRGAFERWERYLVDKRVNDPRFHPDRKMQPGDPGLFLHHEAQPKCNADTDLEFLLGVSTPASEAARQRLRDPIALAARTRRDPEHRWDRGFIWVAEPHRYEGAFPKWEIAPYYAFKATVLHELGHVLGCGHVKYSLMEDDLADHLRVFDKYRDLGDRRYDDDTLFAIDEGWERELLYCENCPTPARRGPVTSEGPLSRELLGRQVYWSQGRIDALDAFATTLSFSLDDGLRFTVDGLARLQSERYDTPVFKLVFRRASGEWALTRSFTETATYSGTARYEGRTRPVIVVRNSPRGRVILRPFPAVAGESRLTIDARDTVLRPRLESAR